MSKSRESYNLLLNKNVTVDNPFNLEATQLDVKNNTDNLDVPTSDVVDAINNISNFSPFQIDAAGRQRSSSKKNYGEYKMLNNVFASLLLEKNGTGTFTDNTNRVTMSVTTGQYCIIQSKQYHPYFNGTSQLIELTTSGLATAANVEKSIGYISSAATGTFSTGLDGFRLFKSTADVYSLQVWRNGSNTIDIPRSTWYDKLDGTGPSGMTINFANFNVYAFDFLYLGGTALRMFVSFNGENILVINHNYANTDTQPIFLSPNKPIRYEIRSTTGTGNMDFDCAMVASEGDVSEQDGTSVTVNAPNAGINSLATGVTYALCGVRKAATQRDIFAFVKSFEGIISTNDFVNLELRLNPTVAGTFTYSALANTPFETATGAIANTVTGGTSIGNTYFSLNMNNSKEIKSILNRLNSTLANTMDSIVLCATPALGSNNVKVTGSMNANWYNQ